MSELRSIAHLIRQRQIADARRALHQYLKAHPDSAEGWYLRSLVAADAEGRLGAAQKAAALDPSNAKYGERLARVLASPQTPARTPIRWWLLPLALLLIAGGALLVAYQVSQPSVILPTPAVFALSELRPPTEAPRATNIVLPSATPAAPTPPSITPESAAPVNSSVTESVPLAVPTLVVVGAIPLGAGADIGGGELRVVEAVRQASAEIAARGGSVPPAPAGEAWVLVELRLVCEAACPTDVGAFRLTGGSGSSYAPAAGFQLAPAFGSEVPANGEMRGYLGFVVPDSDNSLWLTLRQDEAVHRFALQ